MLKQTLKSQKSIWRVLFKIPVQEKKETKNKLK